MIIDIVDRKRVLVIHGGLFSRDGVLLEDLQRLDRHREPDQGLLAELLWSDPQKVIRPFLLAIDIYSLWNIF